MALQPSGPISMSDLAAEFNDSTPNRLGDYYRGGTLVPDAASNSDVPTSGPISMGNFYNASNEVVAVVSSSTTNLDVQALFTAPQWSSNIPKRVIINGGVTVGATDETLYAVTIPGNYSGQFTLQNLGSIQGAGGVGRTGGNALYVTSPVNIDNEGTIYAGGGAGGTGGSGSNGGCGQSCSPGSCRPGNGGCGFCPGCPGGSSCGCGCGQLCGPGICLYVASCSYPSCYNNPTSVGGSGGAGGRGRGYEGANAPGSPGSGSTSCGSGGTGGPGGPGGSWGAAGSTGSSSSTGQAGSGGYAAGYYITGNSFVNWVNQGAVAGQAA